MIGSRKRPSLAMTPSSLRAWVSERLRWIGRRLDLVDGQGGEDQPMFAERLAVSRQHFAAVPVDGVLQLRRCWQAARLKQLLSRRVPVDLPASLRRLRRPPAFLFGFFLSHFLYPSPDFCAAHTALLFQAAHLGFGQYRYAVRHAGDQGAADQTRPPARRRIRRWLLR